MTSRPRHGFHMRKNYAKDKRNERSERNVESERKGMRELKLNIYNAPREAQRAKIGIVVATETNHW